VLVFQVFSCPIVVKTFVAYLLRSQIPIQRSKYSQVGISYGSNYSVDSHYRNLFLLSRKFILKLRSLY